MPIDSRSLRSVRPDLWKKDPQSSAAKKGASNPVICFCSIAKRQRRFSWTSSSGRQVTTLLEKLQAEIEADGKAEAESYDKYAAPRLPRAQRPKLKLSHKV